MNIEKYISKINDSYFLDTDTLNTESDIPVENGDILRFNADGKRYIGKAVEKYSGDGLFELIVIGDRGNI